ncbi:hypothetical protein DRN76_03035 [Methanosarcinales archaeon]|nr:MAG: hypothetical protein DRN76_03035 [Methanosarcinales archaeon]
MGDIKEKIPYIVALLLTAIFILSFITAGFGGILSVLHMMLNLLLFCAIVGLVVYAVWFLFIKKHRVDVNYVNYKNILASSKVSKPPMLNELRLLGDKDHQSSSLGSIVGYCRIKNLETRKDEDVFTVQQSRFPMSMFTEPIVIRTRPTDHTSLIGDVYLKGISIVKVGSFYFLNTRMADVESIDKTLAAEAIRIIANENLAGMKTLIDLASGLDAEHKKLIESKNLMVLPMQQQQGNT